MRQFAGIAVVSFVLVACNHKLPQDTVAEASVDTTVEEETVETPESLPTSDRASAIARDAAHIEDECQKAAQGSWSKWTQQTEPCRAALKARIDKCIITIPVDRIDDHTVYRTERHALAGKDFPLCEVFPDVGLNHLYDIHSLDGFREDRSVIAAKYWLADRGITLIFVPVPRMTEVYVEHFLDNVPADGVIAPHMRQTLLELLVNDVEVVDGFLLFRNHRNNGYLYNTADNHWAPPAHELMAKEVASRLARYDFVAKARSEPPIVRFVNRRYKIFNTAVAYFAGPDVYVDGGPLPAQEGWGQLDKTQQARAASAQIRTHRHVVMPGGAEPPDDPKSPVVLIGHSFVPNFREQLISQLNMLIRTYQSPGNTTGKFDDFLRSPEQLDGCKVIVWLTTEHHMTKFRRMAQPVLNRLTK
jgi:hypothetical protein